MDIELRRLIEADIETWAKAPADRPLLIRGARRVGKTHVVEKVGKRLFGDGFVKLDFQTDLEIVSGLFDCPTDDVDRIVSNIADYKRVPLDRSTSLLMFDEVQLCERALNSLRFFSGSGWRVTATGSQLGVDTRRRTLPFPSGIEQRTMHPMTFEEFLWAVGEEQMATAIRDHANSLLPYAAHGDALSQFRRYQVVGGMPRVVAAWAKTWSLDEVRVQQREIDETYTADMSDPRNGISGVAARRVWMSIPAQLLRSSTKKFKYSEVERGGRRSKLMEPLDWLAAAGAINVNYMTQHTQAPLVPHDDEEGSFFKVYLADTGLMFYKLRVSPRLWLETEESAGFPASSDFRGALAENAVMQALASNELQTFYWTAPDSWSDRGELDFLLTDDLGRLVPVEVKSGRNIRARTLATFMERSNAPYAVILSGNDYRKEVTSDGREMRMLPLYASHCIEEGLVKL